ncbi:hypothetical protein EJD97_023113 [Solanum chilense]|uniref:Uncharacterized protein n=1 Tax=Solanum chilense TaxID=4083 RepID=A0A6N2C5E0_SOLCI|nr:hypothetical protein EJD97_023113 [Solanum chilense]
MSYLSSASKQMLTALSQIEQISLYSPSLVGSRSNIPTSSSLDIPKNPFHSIDLNSLSFSTGPDPYHEMLSDALFERDLPRNKSFESNILAASEELVIESLAMMREEVRVEQSESFQGEHIRETQPIFDRTLDFGRYPSSNSSDSAIDEQSIQWKVERRDVSAEETENEYRKKKSGKTKSRDTKKAEKTKSTKDSSKSVLAGSVFDMEIINQTGMDSLHDMVEIQSLMHLFNKKSLILHEEEVREFYYNIQFQKDGSVHTRVNDIAVHLDEILLGKILRVPRDGTRSLIGKTCYVEFVTLVSKLPTKKCVGLFKKVIKRIMLEHMYKNVIERKGIHGMGYGYFLTEVFKYFNIPLSVGKDQPKHEVEELIMRLSGKDAEIAIFKAELLTAQTEEPGTGVVQALERENAELRAKVIALQ